MEILDDELSEEKIYKYERALSMIVLFSCIIIWKGLYDAGGLPYDENYGALLGSLLLSFVVFIGLIVIFFKWRLLVKRNGLAIVIYLMTSSPISIILVSLYYEAIFGVNLQN